MGPPVPLMTLCREMPSQHPPPPRDAIVRKRRKVVGLPLPARHLARSIKDSSCPRSRFGDSNPPTASVPVRILTAVPLTLWRKTGDGAMSNFDKVESSFANLKYMHQPQATLMRKFIIKHDLREILEIGFFHGKSSAYFAAILEDLGRGHLLTIDLWNAESREPNINDVLSTLGLSRRVTPVFAERSYTWELAKLIQADPRPRFDLCYFDGGHTWDATGFGFALVDMLLKPGGWIIFDDMEWTIDSAMRNRDNMPRPWRACSPDERATPAVKLVFDTLVPHLRYTDRRTMNDGRWGVARKPLDGSRSDSRPGVIEKLRRAFGGQ